MSKEPILILGAKSDMARAVAHRFAREGHPIQLAARDAAGLADDCMDLAVRYNVAATAHAFDALALESHAGFVDSLPELPGVAVCAVGYMGDQKASEADPVAAAQVMRSNFEGPASILALLANRFAVRGSGTLVGISSVAGVRGRASNYVYGSAKAGFTAFLSGLRNRFGKTGVHVVTVLPGFVYTKMTEGMPLPKPLTAHPEEVGNAIFKAVAKRRNVVWVRPVWWAVMMVIRHIPEFVFKKTSL